MSQRETHTSATMIAEDGCATPRKLSSHYRSDGINPVRSIWSQAGHENGPDALRTEAMATGNRRGVVVYWAPGPLPSSRTTPDVSRCRRAAAWLDLAPARRSAGARGSATGQPGFGGCRTEDARASLWWTPGKLAAPPRALSTGL